MSSSADYEAGLGANFYSSTRNESMHICLPNSSAFHPQARLVACSHPQYTTPSSYQCQTEEQSRALHPGVRGERDERVLSRTRAHVLILCRSSDIELVEVWMELLRARARVAWSFPTVIPFNQGSKQDVEALVDYIYTTLGLDLDYVIPFAAVPENGHKIDSLDDKRTP